MNEEYIYWIEDIVHGLQSICVQGIGDKTGFFYSREYQGGDPKELAEDMWRELNDDSTWQ